MRKGSQSPPSDRAPRSRQAPRQGRPPLQRLAAGWVEQHREGARSSLGRLRQTPWSSLMTLLVIGLALALPGALYVLTHNLERLGEGWDQTAAISLFLKIQVDGDQAEALAGRLAKWPDLEGVTLIPPEQALEELRAETGFAEAVEQLETNPLPYVLSLRPARPWPTPPVLGGWGIAPRLCPRRDWAAWIPPGDGVSKAWAPRGSRPA